MPISPWTVNFIFTFPLEQLFLLFVIAPSVTKSRYVLRKALTAVRIQQDKASSECLSNQFAFYSVLQRLKDQLLFYCCSDSPPKNGWECWHCPCSDTQSSGTDPSAKVPMPPGGYTGTWGQLWEIKWSLWAFHWYIILSLLSLFLDNNGFFFT